MHRVSSLDVPRNLPAPGRSCPPRPRSVIFLASETRAVCRWIRFALYDQMVCTQPSKVWTARGTSPATASGEWRLRSCAHTSPGSPQHWRLPISSRRTQSGSATRLQVWLSWETLASAVRYCSRRVSNGRHMDGAVVATALREGGAGRSEPVATSLRIRGQKGPYYFASGTDRQTTRKALESNLPAPGEASISLAWLLS